MLCMHAELQVIMRHSLPRHCRMLWAALSCKRRPGTRTPAHVGASAAEVSGVVSLHSLLSALDSWESQHLDCPLQCCLLCACTA